MTLNIAILIPTRNRPNHLAKLLSSIAYGETLPSSVIIVSSGEDVSSVVRKHARYLNIVHKHTAHSGQIRQKMIGISLVQNNVDWVFFCDDDLLFFPDTLLNVSAVLENRDDMSIKGIGGKLEMFEELNNYPSIRNGTNKFKIKSYQPGKVLKSGDVTQYVHFDEKIHVDWLNGASIWRQDIARKYRFDFLSAKYSAYEDVIFSYQFGKERALFFDPVIRLRFQDEQPQDVSDFMRFSSTQYWKLYFVVSNPELSKRSFLISHAILSIKYLIGSQMKSKILYKEIFKVVILFWKITNLVCKRSGANEILRNVL